MSDLIWDQVKVDSLVPYLQLRELLSSDAERAVFRAEYSGTTERVREVLFQLFLEHGTYAGERVNRFLEGTYLEHPHILRYLNAGTLHTDDGTFTYAVTERADACACGSLAVEEALRFAQHLISGLEYLHARKLVYCVLSPDNVVPVGTDWKLSNFSQLRVAGSEMDDEALSLAATLDTCPPEAVEGLISPAWDIWAFGQTLRKVLTGYKATMRHPFRDLLLACLNINPSSRPSLGQLSSLMEMTRSGHRESRMSNAARAWYRLRV